MKLTMKTSKFLITSFTTTFFILLFCAPQAQASLFAEEFSVEGTKPHLYVAKKDDVYFCMQRIIDSTGINWPKHTAWLDYINIQKVIGHGRSMARNYAKNQRVLEAASFGYERLKGALSYPLDAEVWIAFASFTHPGKTCGLKNGILSARWLIKNVEMSVSISTSDDTPFVWHRGNSRNVAYLTNWSEEDGEGVNEYYSPLFMERAPHRGLSMKLNSFADAIMLALYPEKELMMSSPLPVMRRIMTSALDEGEYFLGDNALALKIKDSTLEDEMALVDYMSHFPSRILKTDDQIHLTDEKGEIIWSYDENNGLNKWFGKVSTSRLSSNAIFGAPLSTMAELHFPTPEEWRPRTAALFPKPLCQTSRTLLLLAKVLSYSR